MEQKYPALSHATDDSGREAYIKVGWGVVHSGGWSMRSQTNETWRIRAESAWRTAARCAALAQEAEKEEREYYIKMRDAWIGLGNRCQFLELPEITKRPRASSNPTTDGPGVFEDR